MKKVIIEKDKKRGVYQITTADERWYSIEKMDGETGLPFFEFWPSNTWITSYVYKGIGYYMWLASKGWDEAEAIKTERGNSGTKVHKGVERLNNKESVEMTDLFMNNETEIMEALTPEEYGSIMTYVDWFKEAKPVVLKSEITVISKKHRFAGTVDMICKIDGQIWIVDFKTSQAVWPSTEAQISAYKQAIAEEYPEYKNVKLAILQLGYNRNKRGYKFTEIEDKFESLWLPAQKFWENDTKGQKPKQIEMPLKLSLPKPEKPKVEQIKKETSVPVKEEKYYRCIEKGLTRTDLRKPKSLNKTNGTKGKPKGDVKVDKKLPKKV